MGRYNAEAAGGREDSQESRNPHGCVAQGCPLAGSIITDGRRTCFVHLAIRETRLWDAATQRILERMSFVTAIGLLRGQGARTDEAALTEARQLVPALDPKHDTPYKALVALETRLTAIARGGEHVAENEMAMPA